MPAGSSALLHRTGGHLFFPKRCEGVVKTNELLMCSWQMVSLANGDKRIEKYDVEDYQSDCVGKTHIVTEMAVIRAQAGAIFERIYQKSLPSGF